MEGVEDKFSKVGDSAACKVGDSAACFVDGSDQEGR